jgi:DNA-binding NtrC family response regulator
MSIVCAFLTQFQILPTICHFLAIFPIKKMAKILIVDDEKSIRKTLREILEYEKYQVDEASDGVEGVAMVQKEKYDIILCDIKMPKMDGMEVLEKIMDLSNDTPVVMISGHGTIDNAVEAIKKGAYDFISKPPDLNRLLVTVRNAIDRKSLVQETKVLKKKIFKTREMIGETAAIKSIKEMVERVAPTEARVLVTGSNGTGKELVAKAIHSNSSRKFFPLVSVHCGSLSESLLESELFGHEKGSFTSAIKQRIGKFEQASGGTLFLDEIGDMSLSAQAKVLRALQEGKITRVGADKDISVDVRVVAATNMDLLKEVEEKRFRLDLYHRLSVILIHVPSLNERRDDIPLLVDRFLTDICGDYGVAKKVIEPGAVNLLQGYNWTGNIRELRNVVERLIILSGKTISEEDINSYVMPK